MANRTFNTDDATSFKLEGPNGEAVTKTISAHPLTKTLQSKKLDLLGNVGEEGELTVMGLNGKEVWLHAILWPSPETKVNWEGNRTFIVKQDGGGVFLSPYQSTANTTGSPGNASHAITVGSYDWNNLVSGRVLAVNDLTGNWDAMTVGALSAYSSRGSRNYQAGSSKPDIASPGQYFLALRTRSNIAGNEDHEIDPFRSFNGTSAATPYTAGVIALMMEAKPDLTSQEIRTLFAKHVLPASKNDEFVKDSFGEFGELPNGAWGYGRLDTEAVKSILDELLTQKKNK